MKDRDEYESVGLDFFFGGWSSDRKLGTQAQFYYSKHADFRKLPGQFSVLPGTSDTSGGVVIDLGTAMDQVPSGVRYMLGDAGNIYKISTSNVFSSVGQLGESGGAGLVYRADVDMMYASGVTKVSRIKNIASSAVFEQNWFQRGVSADSGCTKTGGTNTYSLTTSINEGTNHKRELTSDIEPFYSVKVKVVTKGTGNWTLTLHDDANNSLGTSTVATANLTNNSLNEFVFSTPVRALVKPNARTYHYHLTSTVADGTVQTTTASSLADCDMQLWANALVETKNGLHPMMNFTNLTLIGNERYVAAYEPLQDLPTTSDFKRHKLTLPPGFEVCGFAQKNLLAIIGAEKRSTSGEFQEGALFFWDGVATTYNDWWPVPEGSPEALFAEKNIAHYIAGGSLYRMRGTEEPQKIRTFRNTDSEFSDTSDTTHVNPNMMTVRRGILLIGYPTTTTNTSLEHGVYSLGAISKEYPESFGFSYTIPTGSILKDADNNLKIGMIKNYGDTLYISYRDDDGAPQDYGVATVNNSSDPASSAVLETLLFDNNAPAFYKRAGFIVATFADLPSGVSITSKYKIDREASWHSSEAVTSGTFLVQPIDLDFLSIEFGLDITTGTTTPEIASLHLFFDPLKGGRPVG